MQYLNINDGVLKMQCVFPEDIKQTVCVLKKAKPILIDGYLTLIHIADDAFSASSLDCDQIVQYLDEPGGKINLNSLSATE